MAKEMAALKVRILRNLDGSAKYPNFTQCECVQRAAMNWSHYIDKEGSGWLYDSQGFDEDEEEGESPVNEHWGIMLVPEEFADEAQSRFPNLCFRLTCEECCDFYERRHAKEFDDQEVNTSVLEQIKLKKDLGIPLTERDNKALDPSDETTPGIRKNYRKCMSDYCSKRGYKIKDPPGVSGLRPFPYGPKDPAKARGQNPEHLERTRAAGGGR